MEKSKTKKKHPLHWVGDRFHSLRLGKIIKNKMKEKKKRTELSFDPELKAEAKIKKSGGYLPIPDLSGPIAAEVFVWLSWTCCCRICHEWSGPRPFSRSEFQRKYLNEQRA